MNDKAKPRRQKKTRLVRLINPHTVRIIANGIPSLYTMIRPDNSKVYLVNLDSGLPYTCTTTSCTCNDATYRNRVCKHSEAIFALIKRKKIQPLAS